MKIVSRGIQVNVSSAKTNIRSDSSIINKVSFTTEASNIAWNKNDSILPTFQTNTIYSKSQ